MESAQNIVANVTKIKNVLYVMNEQDDRGLYCCVPEVVHSERWTSGVGCQMCLADDSGDEGKCK